jgi:hypothetical protein
VSLAVLALAPGVAAADCRQQVIDDWRDNGVIDVTFEASCYARVLAQMPADARAYSDFAAAVQRAAARDRGIRANDARARERAAAARRASAGRGTATGGFRSSPTASRGPDAPVASPSADPAGAPADVVSGDDLPVADGPEPAVVTDVSDAGSDPGTGDTGTVDPQPVVEQEENLQPSLAAGPSDPFAGGGAGVASDPAVPGPVLVVGALALLLGALGWAGLAAQRRREGLH